MAGYGNSTGGTAAPSGRVASAHRRLRGGLQIMGSDTNKTKNSRAGLTFQIALTPSGHIVHLYKIGGKPVTVDMGLQPNIATGVGQIPPAGARQIRPATPAAPQPQPVLGTQLQDGTGLFDPFAQPPKKGVLRNTPQQRAQEFARRQRAAQRRARGQRTLNV
jgi:hypothetical protein